jgi:hypothetical protein
MTTAFFPRKIRFITWEILDLHENGEEGKSDRSNNRSLVRRGEERVAVTSQCAPWLKLMAAQHSRNRTDLVIVRQSIVDHHLLGTVWASSFQAVIGHRMC